jgi:hypothetical protein
LEQIEKYVNDLQIINMHKEVMLHWAISRGQYHEGGVDDFFKSYLPSVRKLLPKMEASAYEEYRKINPIKERAPG